MSTARMFDRETVASYIMAIKVTDGRLPERTAYCVVRPLHEINEAWLVGDRNT